MKSLIPFISFLLIFTTRVHAQTYTWAKAFYNTNTSFSLIAADHHNNTIVSGTYSDSIKIGSYTLTDTGTAIFIVKFDSTGNILWCTTTKGRKNSVSSIIIDNDDDICIAGNNVLNIYFTNSDSLISPRHYFNGFIAKYNSSGKFLWATGMVSDRVIIPLIRFDHENNIIVAADFFTSVAMFGRTVIRDSLASNTFFIAKLNTDGALQWLKTGANVSIWALTCDNSGNTYLTGSISNDMYLDSTLVLIDPFSPNQAFICKLDSSGIPQWGRMDPHAAHYYFSSGDDIIADTKGATYTFGSIDTISSSGMPTYFQCISKYDAFGNEQWTKNIVNTYFNSSSFSNMLGIDSNDNLYIALNFYDTLNVGGRFYYTSDTNMIIVKIDTATGIGLSAMQNKGIINNFAVTPNGDFNVAGEFFNSLEVGKIALSASNSSAQTFVAHWGYGAVQNVEMTNASRSFTVYPVPATHQLHVKFADNNQRLVYIANNIGQKSPTTNCNGNTLMLDISNLAPGNYFIIVVEAGITSMSKFVKM